ncbi:zinc-binding dehydrogenase [Nocardia sp. CDC159]|uniref:Zinc-binding dehydrogenase n=1 Tax=Nocardia pulmonis TaxID=2951408 RepID=A0A9X2E2R3_9NOCA|nr:MULTISPECIES: zinc-binding dehydrogenase [Nocardia]MCM6772580.1 zinc-binding dehydrogenase [Nocardia pulmonis]MCM6784762.1 zinc-binding dehydrogenase [Nocardia sp. CDC159]
MPVSSQEWRLIRRPAGAPAPADFDLATTTVGDPGPGQVLVANQWLSVDPYTDKVARPVSEFGFDAAIDYRAGDPADLLTAAAPAGIDVYFDNVGGAQLQAALAAMNPFGRIALCGWISGYNATEPLPGPANLNLAITKRITLRGYLVGDHLDRAGDWVRTAARWLDDGSLRVRETVVEGIEHALDAFLGMMGGANTGKMLVRLASRTGREA